MISTASVSANHTDKGVFHFLVALFVVIWFHHVLVQKFEFSIKLKHENIIKLSINPELCDSLKTVYVENITSGKYKTIDDLKRLFNSLVPNCIDEVYPIHEYKELEILVKKYKCTNIIIIN